MAEPWVLNTGTLVEIAFPQVLFGQRMLNFLHYKATVSAPVADGQVQVDALVDVLVSPAGIRGLMQLCQTVDVIHGDVTSQVISPVRRARVTKPSSTTLGGVASATLPQNIQASIVKRGAIANRHNIGAMRIGGLAVNAHTQGKLTNGFFPTLENVAEAMDDVIETGTVTWTPVIYNRAAPATSVRVDRATAQLTVRTQRTRTAGRGE